MDIRQLRSAVAAADELHFGRGARTLGIAPAALGRHIRDLEMELGLPLFERTTRAVSLTAEGQEFVVEGRRILREIDALAGSFRGRARSPSRTLRVGTIDSAAIWLVPRTVARLHEQAPTMTSLLVEDKTIRLLPKLLSGSIDLAIVRLATSENPRFHVQHLIYETPVVALPADHVLASRTRLSVRDIADVPLIVPDRRTRPHSHDLTMKLFEENRLVPKIAQVAEEKQTILNLVAAGVGGAIVPVWSTTLVQSGVVFREFETLSDEQRRRLPLSAVWLSHVRDTARDLFLASLEHVLATRSIVAPDLLTSALDSPTKLPSGL